jgi:hypothetical protein
MSGYPSVAISSTLIEKREKQIAAQIARLPSGWSCRPDFFIVGAPRAATTWLARVLAGHPGIYIPEVKELKYFSSMLLRLDVSDYLRQFTPGKGRLLGDASVSYGVLPLRRIQLIQQLNPRAKVVYVLREPGDRLISDCQHTLGEDQKQDCEEIKKYVFSDGPVVHSDYAENLRRWLNVFPPSQVMICFYDHLVQNAREFVDDVLRFLDMQDSGWGRLSEPIHRSRPSAVVREVVRSFYPTLFAKRVRELRTLLEEVYPTVVRPKWLEEDADQEEATLKKVIDYPDGRSLYVAGGFYVFGPRRHLDCCVSLDEAKKLAEGFSGVGIGRLQSEAVARAASVEDLDTRCLLSLAHGDLDPHDLFLVWPNVNGWNIVYWQGRFVCASIEAGVIDFRTLDMAGWKTLKEMGLLRDYSSMEEACEFAVSCELGGGVKEM